MMSLEEVKVLTYLRAHLSAAAVDVARACLPGAKPDWVQRAVSNLDWLGYVTVYYGMDGQPCALQITERGLGKPAHTAARL